MGLRQMSQDMKGHNGIRENRGTLEGTPGDCLAELTGRDAP